MQSEEIFKQPTNGKRHDKSHKAKEPNEKLIQQHIGEQKWNLSLECQLLVLTEAEEFLVIY
jgi:hypothetical protein